MSSPLIILACILGVFAFVLIPLMMTKGQRTQNEDRQRSHVNRREKSHKKKKKR